MEIMEKRDLVVKILKEFDCDANYDEESNVIWANGAAFFIGDVDKRYMAIILPQFIELEDGESVMALKICHRLTRDTKLCKVYLNEDEKSVSSLCDFYYTDEESLRVNIEKVFAAFELIESLYNRYKAEMS